MHGMTKVLIALCALASLVLAALTMAFAANADAIRGDYAQLDARYRQALADNQQKEAQWGEERTNKRMQIESLNNTLAERDRVIADLQNERSVLRVELEQARARAVAIENKIDQLAATTDTQAALIRGYRDEVRDLRNEQVSMARREVQLVDRINDLESQREVLDQTTRALREQLAEAQLALEAAMAGRDVDEAADEVEYLGPPIRSRVVEVFTSPAGDEMAVIAAGTNSGLRENMRLSIIRGEQFLANFVITRADPQRAVGRIDKLSRPVEVREGDMVLTRLD